MTRYLWSNPRITIEGDPDLADAIDSAFVESIYAGSIDHLLGACFAVRVEGAPPSWTAAQRAAI